MHVELVRERGGTRRTSRRVPRLKIGRLVGHARVVEEDDEEEEAPVWSAMTARALMALNQEDRQSGIGAAGVSSPGRSRIEPTPPLRPSREAMVADDDADEDVLSPQHYLSYV